MDKKNVKKIIIISTISVIALIGGVFGTYKYNKVQAYNNLITTANKYMDSGEYDKAITLFEQSLQYKKDYNVEKNISLAKNLKNFKSVYDDGIKLMNDKKYLEAIEKFEIISKDGLKWYTDSQKKIEECKKQFIAQNIQSANDSAKNAKYDEANKYLDNILKIDVNNADAKNLKDTFAKALKEQQENANRAEEAKQLVQKNIDNDSTQTNNNMAIIHQYNNRINTIDKKIDELHRQESMYAPGSPEVRQCLQQQIDLLKQRNEIVQEATDFVNKIKK